MMLHGRGYIHRQATLNRARRKARRGNGDNWIQRAIKKPGQLRRDLGIPEGKRIPLKTLKVAAKHPGKTGQRARLALNLRGLSRRRKHRGGKLIE